MPEHRIVAVAFLTTIGPCAQCAPDRPHNICALCACGERASGIKDHTWTVSERVDDRVTLTPSFNWLNDPRDPSKGSHLHEFVNLVPLSKMKSWPVRDG